MSNQKRFALIGRGYGSGVFDEYVQDLIGGILVDSSEINFTYTDATPSITAALIDASITFARLQNFDALSVLGRSANSSGVSDEIAAATTGDILNRNGTTLGFGQTLVGEYSFTNRILVGSTVYTAINSGGAVVPLQIVGTTLATSGTNNARFSNDATGTVNNLLKSRSGTIGTPAIVQVGDNLGRIAWSADDGTDFVTQGARIDVVIVGTPAADAIAADWVLEVNSGGTVPTPLLRAGRHSNSGAEAFFRLSGNSNDTGAFDRTSAGIELQAATMPNDGAFPLIKWTSTDAQLTTNTPRMVAFIGARSTQAFDDDNDGGTRIVFGSHANNPGTGDPTIYAFMQPTEFEFTSTLFDFNGNLDLDGTTHTLDGTTITATGGSAVVTLAGTEVDLTATTLDFNGQVDISGAAQIGDVLTVLGAGIVVSNDNGALVRMTDSNGTSGAKNWRLRANTASFVFAPETDALSVVENAIICTANGSSEVTLVQLLGDEIDLTGTTFDFNGTLDVDGAAHDISTSSTFTISGTGETLATFVDDGAVTLYHNNVSRIATSATGVDMVAGTFRLFGYTVAALPAGTIGQLAYVTDALAPVFGAAVAGGGAVMVPVYYTGAAWFVG